MPVRHNEDNLNEHLAKSLPMPVDNRHYDAPSVKAHLLLQCHMHRGTLPSSDYLLDTKTVMDNTARVIQSMIDISAEMGLLCVVVRMVRLLQAITQARWPHDDPFLTIPHVERKKATFLRKTLRINHLGELVAKSDKQKVEILKQIGLSESDLGRAEKYVMGLPDMKLTLALSDDTGESEPIQIPDAYFG